MKKHLSPEKIATSTLEQVRRSSKVPIDVVASREALAVCFAETVLGYVRRANRRKKRVTMIMPVGPTGQWKLMADMAIGDGLDLSRLSIIQMDEYLTAEGNRVPATDPFSFTRFVQQAFGRRVGKKCGFKKQNWIVPDPADTAAVDRAIKRWGGVDVAFAGIGLNGHMAFNEPPLATGAWTDESFASSPTRIVKLAETTQGH